MLAAVENLNTRVRAWIRVVGVMHVEVRIVNGRGIAFPDRSVAWPLVFFESPSYTLSAAWIVFSTFKEIKI